MRLANLSKKLSVSLSFERALTLDEELLRSYARGTARLLIGEHD